MKTILYSELNSVKELVEPHIFSVLQNENINKFESHPALDLISFDWYDVGHISQKHCQITIYFTAEQLIFICENKMGMELLNNWHSEAVGNGRLIQSFFSDLVKNDIDKMEDMEEKITGLEDDLLTMKKQDITKALIRFRRKLLLLKKYYEQLSEILFGLVSNENDLIEETQLRSLRILDSKIDRLFNYVLNLRDYVTQVREAYQAEIDIEQNNLMRIFTVITTIFLPLTLIVGWFGMNVKMPEFSWDFGYPYVIILSLAVIAACVIYFKKKKWF